MKCSHFRINSYVENNSFSYIFLIQTVLVYLIILKNPDKSFYYIVVIVCLYLVLLNSPL